MGLRIRDRDRPWTGGDYVRLYPLAVLSFGLTYLALGAALWGDDLDRGLVGRSVGWGVLMGLVWVGITWYQQRAKGGGNGDGVGRGL
jgi:hypothetical protein